MAESPGFDIAHWEPPGRVWPQSWWKRAALGIGLLVGRSLFPILTLVIIGGTVLWGPWVTLILAGALFIAAIRWA
jgi:hypothetical protein